MTLASADRVLERAEILERFGRPRDSYSLMACSTCCTQDICNLWNGPGPSVIDSSLE